MTQELPEGTVTVLFSDVVGSTDLTTSRGDEAAQDILRAQRELVRGQVEEHSGHEVKSIGDGFMVAFGSARRAVACAVGIQRALQEHNRSQPLDEHVQVRIGMNTGEVLREEADLFGETVNAAARIAGKAKGGQVLISDATKGVLGRAKDLELVDRGRFRLKGFPERWRLFEVIWQEEKPAVGPALVERTPFVGREAERAEMRRFLDQVAGGRGDLVMIGGEPGVGKTRLAEELMVEARQRGMTAFIGHCYEMEGAPPYIPYVEILEAATRMFPKDAMRETLSDSAPEVAKLMPELRRIFPDIPESPELPPEQERRYLFNGMRDFVARTGRDQPAVYVLDDLHWATDASLLLLQHIAQQLHEMPVLIVGTYRDVELAVNRPLAGTLRELTRQRLSHDLILKRLPQDGVAAMLRALSGQDPPRALVDVVYSETEGNPFFVEEVYGHFADEGKLFDAQGRWRPDLDVSELDVPRGVRLVIGQRLEHLDEKSQQVLTMAAVVGRSFTFELLAVLGDVDDDALVDAIDEAERAQLITPASDGREERFTFAHELIRQTLVAGLSSPRRRRLHLRVAEAMEQAYVNQLEEHAADLAHHLDQAGSAAEPEKTVHYLILAGEQAYGAAAFEEALRHYENALSLQPTEDERCRVDCLSRRGLALRSLGRWDEALTDWQEAMAAYKQLGDIEALGQLSAHITNQLAWVARWGEAARIATDVLRVMPEDVDANRCRLLAAAGTLLSLAGSHAQGDALISQALAMADEIGDDHLLGGVHTWRIGHHWGYLEVREAVAAGKQAAELLRSAGDLWSLAAALWGTEYALLFLGRLDETEVIREEAEPLAHRLGEFGALLAIRRVSATREFMLSGDIEAFEEFGESDLELCRSTGMPWISNSYTIFGYVRFLQGRWTEALEHYQEGAKLEPGGFWAGFDWVPLFQAKAYIGEADSAIAELEQRRGNLPKLQQPNTFGSWTMLLGVVEGLAVLGRRTDAAGLYDLVLQAIGTGAILIWFSPLIQLAAGIAASCGEQWQKAEEHYEAALRQAHELPHKIQQPEVRRWYARMLIDRDARGDRDKARQLLTEAIAMYRDIGMPKHVEMAEAMLGEV